MNAPTLIPPDDIRPKCCDCGQSHDRGGQRHCRPRHAAYMRKWRKAHPPLTEDQRRARRQALKKVRRETTAASQHEIDHLYGVLARMRAADGDAS